MCGCVCIEKLNTKTTTTKFKTKKPRKRTKVNERTQAKVGSGLAKLIDWVGAVRGDLATAAVGGGRAQTREALVSGCARSVVWLLACVVLCCWVVLLLCVSLLRC